VKTIIWKAYWNYEKEEKWLNEMAAKGLALTDYSWCRYAFADCEPGEYTYRIELLQHLPYHPESQKYMRFMEDNGVEHVASYNAWIYFRKKTSEGTFDIYSDIDSRIRHYRRVNLMWSLLACAEILVGIPNIMIGLSLWGDSHRVYPFNFTAGVIVVCIGLVFIALGHPMRKHIKRLKHQKMVSE